MCNYKILRQSVQTPMNILVKFGNRKSRVKTYKTDFADSTYQQYI